MVRILLQKSKSIKTAEAVPRGPSGKNLDTRWLVEHAQLKRFKGRIEHLQKIV